MVTAEMRVAALLSVLSVVPGGPLAAQTREVAGAAGVLGEWEITATVKMQTDGGEPRWRGPLSMKHVGICSADGPEEKTGELRLTVSNPSNAVNATLLIDGEVCTFSGQRREGYEGIMNCPDARSVPMMLLFEAN
jgi:hypothetical protein